MVISIIALLIALLLPALGNAREEARVAVCLSGQRQTLVALHSYAAMTRQGYPWRHESQPLGESYQWVDEMVRGGFLADEKGAFCSAQPMNYGFSYNSWAFGANGLVGWQVPTARRMNPYFQYFARAKGLARLTSSQPSWTINTLSWGWLNGFTANRWIMTPEPDYWGDTGDPALNAEKDRQWARAIPAIEFRYSPAPILSCPVVQLQGTTPQGLYYKLADWGPIYHMAPHRRRVSTNYGNNDGSVFGLTFPHGDFFAGGSTFVQLAYIQKWGTRN